ncbi:molybdenum ABC transporter ATP-binding protein [Skermanella sp. TT6]|uniref:Molybdenum ABC transporter ATP-binding protein n=1 Tax=Skermanella cutis TaxID=2775420 RepID=A0ABX7B4J8_9PROT|nr:molybdenum ABC transporter ATP-binding protein [Skermanella sp. TT6]QQP89261.1 molybdenum ABC transporter ATP-binding protein [Skermanella sp. TT6]
MLDVAIRRRQGTFDLDIRFQAPSRGVTALFGRSGSGKSSVINAIAGLAKPDAGHILLDGTVLFDGARRIDVPAERRRTGYVFQDSRLFPHMSVQDNLLYGMRRVPREERRIALEPVVDLLGIGGLLKRRPYSLSGGEKQRVAVGRALLAQPRILLMDEPLASLDAERKAEILPYIERLRDELNIPIVFVSHSVDEVVRLATTLVLVADGRVRAAGTVAELSGRLDVGGTIGGLEAGAVLDTTVAGHDAATGLTELRFPGGILTVPLLDLRAGQPLRVRIQARDVILALEPPSRISVHNMLEGRIVELGEAAGPSRDVRIDLGGSFLLARVTRHSVERLGLGVGTPVFALVKSVAFDRVFPGPAGRNVAL